MVLLIPDEKDLRWLRDHGTLPYAELANRLRNAGVIVPGIAEEMSKYLSSRDPCELYTRCGGGHFTPDGYQRLAEIVFAKLREVGWVSARLSAQEKRL